MKKKVIKALSMVSILCTIMLLFAGCGETYSFYSTMKSISDVKNFNYTATIEVTTDMSQFNQLYTVSNTEYGQTDSGDTAPQMQTFHVKVSGTYNDAASMSMKLEYQNEDTAEYVPVTDICVVDKDAYINVKSILTMIGMDTMPTGDSISGDYYKLSLDEVTREAEENETKTSSTINKDAYKTVLDDIVDTCVDFVEKAAKDIKPELTSKEGDMYVFKLSDENVQQFMNNLGNVLSTDFAKTLDEKIDTYTKKGADYTDIVTTMNKVKTDDAENIQETINKLKDFKYESKNTFSAQCGVSCGTQKDGAKTTNLNISVVETNENNVAQTVKFDYQSTENKSPVEIKSPESLISEEQVQTLFGGLFGGLFSGLAQEQN